LKITSTGRVDGGDYTREDDKAFTVWKVEEKIAAISYVSSNAHYLEVHPEYTDHEKEIIIEIEKQGKKEEEKDLQKVHFYASELDSGKLAKEVTEAVEVPTIWISW